MPWEKGPLAPVFNREPVMKRFAVKPCAIGLADVLSPEPKKIVQPPAIPVGTIAAPQDLVKRRIALTSYNIQEDELRSRALNKFKVLVSLDPHATKIGRSMLDALGRLEDNDTMMHILSDSLATKATGTLTKRASALWRWANWLAESRMGTCFRQTEANVYKYMNFLREQGYAPTAASHFLEALGFAHQVFTLCHMNPSAVLTSRVKGAAHSMFCRRESSSKLQPSQWKRSGPLRPWYYKTREITSRLFVVLSSFAFWLVSGGPMPCASRMCNWTGFQRSSLWKLPHLATRHPCQKSTRQGCCLIRLQDGFFPRPFGQTHGLPLGKILVWRMVCFSSHHGMKFQGHGLSNP